MASEVTITKEHNAGLYDSATGKTLTTEKVVDVSDDCPSGERIIFLYTRAKRGRIVQISHPYEGHTYRGMHIHFFVDELKREMRMPERDDTFGVWAKMCGLNKQRLLRLIQQYAPA